ncbi:MAG: DUF3943 domain-containing protein [Spirochaetales bacterium]|nr:DUF3943 domain-containing protein [Spirochaetales bacterium]
MRKITFSLMLVLFFASFSVSAQSESESHSKSETEVSVNQPSNTGFGYDWNGWLHENDGKKHYISPAAGALFWDCCILGFSRYINVQEWAQITLDDWKYVWRKDTEWDIDNFQTNLVLHPVQEGMVFLGARASNLSFYEALAYATINSFVWEYFGETELPSRNDFIYSPLGAIAVGETLHRLSLEADQYSGLLGLCLNPARLWSQSFLRQKPQGPLSNELEIGIQFSMGTVSNYMKILNNSEYRYNQLEHTPLFTSPIIYVTYNDPYGHDSNDPYSQFELELSAGVSPWDTSYNGPVQDYSIFSEGIILSRAPDFGEKIDTTVAFEFVYDFEINDSYMISTCAPGFAFKQRFRKDSGSKIEWQIHANGIALGGNDDLYYFKGITKQTTLGIDYHYCFGVENILKFRYITANNSYLFFNAHNYAFYDIDNPTYYHLKQDKFGPERTDSGEGWALVSLIKVGAEVSLSKKVAIGVQDNIYLKRTFLKDQKDYYQAMHQESVYFKIYARK